MRRLQLKQIASLLCRSSIGGHSEIMFGVLIIVLGRYPIARRGLAVTTAKRSQLAPELPSAAEAGVHGFEVTGWFALFVPRRTSRTIVEKIHIDMVTALRDPAVRANFDNIGMVAVGSTPEELARPAHGRDGKMAARDQTGSHRARLTSRRVYEAERNRSLHCMSPDMH